MPITVTCDECSESHRVKDDAVGKKFKCKGCGKSLKIVAPPPPEEDFGNLDETDFGDDEAEDTESYSRKKAPKRAKSASAGRKSSTSKSKSVPIGRTKVPLGIDCVYFGFLLKVLVSLCVASFGPKGNPSLLFTFYWLGFGAVILTTVGQLLCLTAPPQMSGKGVIYVAALIDLSSLIATLAKLFGALPRAAAAVDNLLWVIGMICFIMFLQSLGDFLGERDLRERGSGVFRMGIGYFVLSALQVGLLALALTRALHPLLAVVVGLPLGLTLLVVGIIVVVRYVGLLSTCRYALSNA